jgi:hypothetical protein
MSTQHNVFRMYGQPTNYDLPYWVRSAIASRAHRAAHAQSNLVAALRQIVIESTESPLCDAARLGVILSQARAALASVHSSDII